MNQPTPGAPAPGSSRHTTGLLLIVLGLIFLAETHHGIFGWNFTFGRLWPMLLIVAGLARLMGPHDARASAPPQAARAAVADPPRPREDYERRRRRGRSSELGAGTWLIFLGFLFLLHTNGVMSLQRSWPLFIVWAGVSIMFAHRFAHRPVEPGASPEIPPAPAAPPPPPVSSTPSEPPAGSPQP
jgi:hypothetical protein